MERESESQDQSELQQTYEQRDSQVQQMMGAEMENEMRDSFYGKKKNIFGG